jgi:hypothetical protein
MTKKTGNKTLKEQGRELLVSRSPKMRLRHKELPIEMNYSCGRKNQTFKSKFELEDSMRLDLSNSGLHHDVGLNGDKVSRFLAIRLGVGEVHHCCDGLVCLVARK